jgi:hypothetical protein
MIERFSIRQPAAAPANIARWRQCASATAPSMKAIKAMDDLVAEKPGAPASANPRNTTFPVMFPVNTWPKARRLTASTIVEAPP